MKLNTLATIVLSASIAAVAGANTSVKVSNKLGLKLAKETAKELKGKNFMISPVSLQQALTLALNGTNAQTRLESEELLGAGLMAINADSAKNVKNISFSVEQKKKLQAEFPYATPSVVSIQNSIWHTNGKTDGRRFAFSDSFKDTARKFYSADSQSHDFKTQGAVDAINGWAKEKTYGLVPQIIDLDALKPMLWVVMNASYIEASWRQSFFALTQDAPAFELADGTKVKAKMIQCVQHIAYAKLPEGGELAAIPFSSVQGSPELEFVVYLPSSSQDTGLMDHNFWLRTQGLLKNIDSSMKARVTLPKFSFDTSVEMKKDQAITQGMGLNFLFENWADFSAMATADSVPSKVGLIKQNSRIELDEKGVKAAAVTIIGGIERTSMPTPPSVNLVVNRPFQFAIVEKTSKTILFIGSVVDPR